MANCILNKGIASIDDISVGNEGMIERPADIYTIQGICLKRNASEEDIRSLNPGLYIVGGKKVIVK